MKRLRHTAQVNGEGFLAPIPAEVGKSCSSASPLISQSPILPPMLLGNFTLQESKASQPELGSLVAEPQGSQSLG